MQDLHIKLDLAPGASEAIRQAVTPDVTKESAVARWSKHPLAGVFLGAFLTMYGQIFTAFYSQQSDRRKDEIAEIRATQAAAQNYADTLGARLSNAFHLWELYHRGVGQGAPGDTIHTRLTRWHGAVNRLEATLLVDQVQLCRYFGVGPSTIYSDSIWTALQKLQDVTRMRNRAPLQTGASVAQHSQLRETAAKFIVRLYAASDSMSSPRYGSNSAIESCAGSTSRTR